MNLSCNNRRTLQNVLRRAQAGPQNDFSILKRPLNSIKSPEQNCIPISSTFNKFCHPWDKMTRTEGERIL